MLTDVLCMDNKNDDKYNNCSETLCNKRFMENIEL
jgi:hypothetical protein